MDPEVVEKQKPSVFKKQKQQNVFPDVIHLEGDDDLVVLGETSSNSKRYKGKAVKTNHSGYGDHQVVPGFGKFGIQYSNGQPWLKSSYNLNVPPEHAHPQGLESRNPWLKSSYNFNALPEHAHSQELESKNHWLNSSYNFNAPLEHAHPQGLESSNPWLNSSYNFNALHGHAHPQGLESSNPWLNSIYNFNAPPKHVHPQGLESSNPWLNSSYNFNAPPEHAHPQGLESKNHWLNSSYNFNVPPEHAHPQGLESSNPWLNSSYNFNTLPEHAHPQGLESSNPWLNSSYNFNAPPKNVHPHGLESNNPWLKSSYNFNAPFGHAHPQGLESSNPWLKSSYIFNAPPEHAHPQGLESSNPWLKSSYIFNAPPENTHNGASVVPPGLTTITEEPENETLRKLRSFKQFDTVVDTSDHHFVRNNSSMMQNPRSWAKKIQDEWKILEKHLPDTIFVRVFESRVDLLRAVIIGAEGTPYHDGLFFFDVLFPSDYPNVPPQVHYRAGGLWLNPNLYATGKVCLSLLNTWHGNMNERWIPGISTMLQVLVSIQGLILNAKPFFNEPGHVHMSGSQIYEAHSLNYNENTFIQSVRTMMYTIKKPPKNFEELVVRHFYSRAHDILASSKAYMEGVQVGSFVKAGLRDVDKGGRKSSDKFKADLLGCVKLLVQEFEKIGVKDCQKFMSRTSPKPCTVGGRFA